VLPLNVWDILVAEQLSSEEYIAIGSVHTLILNMRIMNMGSSVPFDILYTG
jgi:hypothetical protein